MKIILVEPSGNFEKAHEWAKNYKTCEDCKFAGIFSLMVRDEYIPMLAFKVNYPHEESIVQFVSDITSLDGTYYKF